MAIISFNGFFIVKSDNTTLQPNITMYILHTVPYTGREINFFSDSHLAPKFFKVVAKWKKVGHHFQRQTKPSFKPSAF